MRKGTTRGRLCLIGALLLGGIAGCGADEQTTLIAQANAKITDVTGKLGEIKTAVQNSIDASKKDGREITAPDEQLILATEAAKKLRELGEYLQRVKEYTDRAKDKTSPAYSKELLERYRNGIRGGLENLIKEDDAVRVVIAQAQERANEKGKEELTKLQQTLREATGAFDLLNKVR